MSDGLMQEAQELYHAAGRAAGGVESQMFGKPCYKAAGKAFVCLFGTDMVFKLPPGIREQALQLDRACLFDPSGKGHAMKEWVQLPPAYKDKWATLALQAAQYVAASA